MNTGDKYRFKDLKIGQVNIMSDKKYDFDDYKRALSCSYQYRKRNNLLGKVRFKIKLINNCLNIYRIE